MSSSALVPWSRTHGIFYVYREFVLFHTVQCAPKSESGLEFKQQDSDVPRVCPSLHKPQCICHMMLTNLNLLVLIHNNLQQPSSTFQWHCENFHANIFSLFLFFLCIYSIANCTSCICGFSACVQVRRSQSPPSRATSSSATTCR